MLMTCYPHKRRNLSIRCITAILILVITQTHTQGFSSLTKFDAGKAFFKKPASGFIHGELTRRTLCALNLKNTAVLRIVEVNWRIDWDSNSRDLETYAFGKAKLLWRPNDKYRPEFHFDRNIEDRIIQGGVNIPNHRTPFVRGVGYLQERRKIIVDGLFGRNGRDVANAQTAIGQALHAMQDFFSHSNVTDLPEAEWNQVMQQLERVSGPVGTLPLTLKITGFDKNISADFEIRDFLCSKNPLKPYGHDACGKDSDTEREARREMESDAFRYVAGKTKFVRAKEAAVEFSIKWLQAVKIEVGAANWRKIEDDGTSPCQVNFAFNPSEETVAGGDGFVLDLSEFEAVKHGNWLESCEHDPASFELR